MNGRLHTLVLPAPAKVNLFLHITGQRSDGYHVLQTAFQLLNFGDELSFTLRDDGQIQLHAPMLNIPPEENLVIRAARLLKNHMQSSYGADISLNKRLPSGGGLGGGSSDAATTLLGLTTLWQMPLDLELLATLALQLGADVPVFVRGRSAWAEGIGEQLQPITLPECWFLVLTPACSISTAEIFSAQELTRNTPPITIAAFLREGGHNDCQPVVEKRYPAVKETLAWLSQFATCRMTGTGASVFAAFSTETQARAVLAQKPIDVAGFVAQGVNVSPAHRLLGTKL